MLNCDNVQLFAYNKQKWLVSVQLLKKQFTGKQWMTSSREAIAYFRSWTNFYCKNTKQTAKQTPQRM